MQASAKLRPLHYYTHNIPKLQQSGINEFPRSLSGEIRTKATFSRPMYAFVSSQIHCACRPNSVLHCVTSSRSNQASIDKEHVRIPRWKQFFGYNQAHTHYISPQCTATLTIPAMPRGRYSAPVGCLRFGVVGNQAPPF